MDDISIRKLNIKTAHKKDLNQILNLLSVIVRHMDEKGIKQWPNWYPNKDIILSDITKNQLIVAEVDSQIIGMVVLSPEIPQEYETIKWNLTEGKVNSIHRLAVHPVLKTKNLASNLMQFAENKACQDGYSIIRLDTYSLNKVANKFYLKIGYHNRGDINLQYMPEKYHCYEKSLC